MASCKVERCRFSSSHVTLGHQCGICAMFGHGILECGQMSMIQDLSDKYGSDIMSDSDKCKIQDCPSPQYHSSASHVCDNCGTRGMSDCCNRSIIQKKCPSCKKDGNIIISDLVFTSGDCIICFDKTPMVVFQPCRHANVCLPCARRIIS